MSQEMPCYYCGTETEQHLIGCPNTPKQYVTAGNEFSKKSALIIATGILGYIKMANLKANGTYLPPSREEVVEKYQNEPLFHTTVDTIVAHIRHAIFNKEEN